MTLVGAYASVGKAEEQRPKLDRFCGGCAYESRSDICPYSARVLNVQHDRCDWSIMQGVGAMPRTIDTLAIWDYRLGKHVPVQRSDEMAVRVAISQSLRTRNSN